MRKLTIVALCLLCVLVSAQQVRRDHISKVTIRGNAGIPKPLSSGRFYRSFTGIMEGNVSVSARIGGALSAGLGYQGTSFKCTEPIKGKLFKGTTPYNTGLSCHAGYVRIGLDKFFKQNAFVAYALNIGQMYGTYTRVQQDSSELNRPLIGHKFSTIYVQPELGVNFVMEQRVAFSLMISYTTLLQHFDARAPRFNHFKEVYEGKNVYLMSYLNFGFGFTVLLGD